MSVSFARWSCALALVVFTACPVEPAVDDPGSAPVLIGFTPASPSNDHRPALSGTAKAGVTVAVYAQADCAGSELAQTQASASGQFSVQLTVQENATTTVSARSQTAAGETSACSGPLAFVEDSVAPARPEVSPLASPTRADPVVIVGHAEPGARVSIHRTDEAGCTGERVVTLDIPASGQFEAPVPVLPNETNTLFFAAMDAAGNTSGCSPALTFAHDAVAPSVPALSATPASPSRTTSPVLTAIAEAGTTVRLFTSGTCVGAHLLGSEGEEAGTFSFTPTVGADSTTTFSANSVDAAGNVSACSAAIVYVADNTAPAAPTFSSVTPGPVSNSQTLQVSGQAEPHSAVDLFVIAAGGEACSGAPLNPGIAVDASGTFSVSVTVAAQGDWTLTARATDAAGGVSVCSSHRAVVIDTTAPDATNAAVADGAGADVLWQTSASGYTLNWAGFTDNRAVDRYEVFLSTRPACDRVVTGSPLTVSGTATDATLTGLSLLQYRSPWSSTTTTYYGCVRALDEAGNASGMRVTDGVRVDSFAPSFTLKDPAEDVTTADRYRMRFSINEAPAAGALESAFTLFQGATELPVSPLVLGNSAVVCPVTALATGETYSVSVQGIVDEAGNAMADASWSFTTGPAWRVPDTTFTLFQNPIALGARLADGTTLVATEHGNRSYATLRPPCLGWLDAETVEIGGTGVTERSKNLDLSVNATEEGLAAWSQDTGTSTPHRVMARAFQQGTSPSGWGGAVAVDGGARAGYVVLVRTLLQDDGDATVAWLESTTFAGRDWALWVNRREAGVWGTPVRLDAADGGESQGVKLVANPDGVVAIVWDRTVGGGSNVLASRYVPGEGWAPPVVLGPAAPEYEASVRSVGALADGGFLAVWYDYAAIRSSRFSPAAGWAATETVALGNFIYEANWVTSAAGAGRVVVAWPEAFQDGVSSSFRIVAKEFNAATGWQASPTLVCNGPCYQPSATVFRSGLARISSFAARGDGWSAEVAESPNGGGWTSHVVAGDLYRGWMYLLSGTGDDATLIAFQRGDQINDPFVGVAVDRQ